MKIIILDRDGTLNQLGEEYITTPAEWQAERGALEAVARLNRAGWHVVVATNQPGLGRGLLDMLANKVGKGLLPPQDKLPAPAAPSSDSNPVKSIGNALKGLLGQ